MKKGRDEMMQRPDENIKLSCLITNYNQISWIGKAVDSILEQDIRYPYEILIGDDGSSDGSLEFLREKYKDKDQVRILVQDRDASVKEFPNWRHSRLIFRLLDEARGEYVSILDGDDYYCDKNHFQHKIELLDRKENSDCSACYGNMYKLIDGKLELYPYIPYTEGKYQWQKDKIYTHLATAVIRRKALEDVPREIFYEQFVDWEVTTWLTYKGLFYYDPKPCFVYRVLENSIFHGHSVDLLSLRQVLICDSNYQAYGGKRITFFRPRKRNVFTLYDRKGLAEDIDYEMWNAFAEKYHATIALMLLNKENLKVSEKLWLWFFVLRLRELWKIVMNRLKGYCIGISQICSPKTSMTQKRKLLRDWWMRITKN